MAHTRDFNESSFITAKEKSPGQEPGLPYQGCVYLHLFRALAGLSIPHAASLLAVGLRLRLGHICSESWDREGEADSQSENRKKDFHGVSPSTRTLLELQPGRNATVDDSNRGERARWQLSPTSETRANCLTREADVPVDRQPDDVPRRPSLPDFFDR